MRPVTDMKAMEKTVEVFAKFVASAKADPTRLRSEVMELELHLENLRAMMTAQEKGKTLVGCTFMTPVEIFHAMDIIPYFIECYSGFTPVFLNLCEDYFAAAKSFGLGSEICSIHRAMAGYYMLGHAPRTDAIITTSMGCDHTAMSGDIASHFAGCPKFFIDRPYRADEESIRYLTKELEQLINFLENLTGRKMDYDRLGEVVANRQRQIAVYQEINELRKAVPAPLKNGMAIFMNQLSWTLSGTPQMVNFLETIRNDASENVRKGKGYYPKENYRLLTLFLSPSYTNTMAWMGEKYGAVDVYNPFFDHWGKDLEIDLRKPLESLARIVLNANVIRPLDGPAAEGMLIDVVQDAKDYQAEGAIFFAHCACRIADGAIRMVKDVLMKEAGIPTAIVDFDWYDATYVTGDEVNNKVESFLELLDERK